MNNQELAALKEAVADIPMVHMPTRHFLLDGMYLRQILIPAGVVFVGRVHKKLHYFICAKGSAGIRQEDDKIQVLRAGMTLLCAPGSRRTGVTYEDTIFLTIHRTDATNLEDIESDCVEFDPASRYGTGNRVLERLSEAS